MLEVPHKILLGCVRWVTRRLPAQRRLIGVWCRRLSPLPAISMSCVSRLLAAALMARRRMSGMIPPTRRISPRARSRPRPSRRALGCAGSAVDGHLHGHAAPDGPHRRPLLCGRRGGAAVPGCCSGMSRSGRMPIPIRFDRWIRSKLGARTARTPSRPRPLAAQSETTRCHSAPGDHDHGLPVAPVTLGDTPQGLDLAGRDMDRGAGRIAGSRPFRTVRFA